ncbi:MAG: hypothetical protein AMJ90_00880 [candidate division Zixibacteria bacterium SM23_73_2]|nr:MAG: hypothetical protein AMJ90_00880 [candidate division Zixibacteria bacterium SM23_73_2]
MTFYIKCEGQAMLKNLKVVCFSFCLLFILFTFHGFVVGQTTPEKEILKVFPNSEITWSMEFSGKIVNFKTIGDCIAILTKNGNQKMITFINYKDSVKWSVSDDIGHFLWYDLVDQRDEKLLVLTGKGIGEAHVFNNKGKNIWKLTRNIGGLHSSPSSEFYYTKQNIHSYDPLRVYNEDGGELWSLHLSGDWQVEALSDSELLCFYLDHCYLFNALTGKEIWKFRFTDNRPFFYGFPEFTCSYDENYFVLFNGWTLFSFDRNSNQLWNKNERHFSSAISEYGRFVALYGKSNKEPKVLSLLDNLNGGKVIWSQTIETEEKESCNNYGALYFDGTKLYLLTGIIDYYFFTGVKQTMATFCFEIDPNTGRFLSKDKFNGVLQVVNGIEKIVYFLTIDKSGIKYLYRIEKRI